MSDMYRKKLEQIAAAREEAKKSEPLATTSDTVAEKAPFDKHGNPIREQQSQASNSSDTSSVILEQAWIMKMAGEIARRVYDEKNRQQGIWEESETAPPPAYEAATH
jgi:distribution and morphology protein 34